jgi:hypothetical protein
MQAGFFRTAGGRQQPPQRLQGAQRLANLDRRAAGRVGRGRRFPAPSLMLRAQRGQAQPPTGLQFEQQAARGKILQPPLGGAPLPPVTEFSGDSLPTPIRVSRQEVLQPAHVHGADGSALTNEIALHRRRSNRNKIGSPDKSETVFSSPHGY